MKLMSCRECSNWVEPCLQRPANDAARPCFDIKGILAAQHVILRCCRTGELRKPERSGEYLGWAGAGEALAGISLRDVVLYKISKIAADLQKETNLCAYTRPDGLHRARNSDYGATWLRLTQLSLDHSLHGWNSLGSPTARLQEIWSHRIQEFNCTIKVKSSDA